MKKKGLSFIMSFALIFSCFINMEEKIEAKEDDVILISDVIVSRTNTLIITEENELWGCGSNTEYKTNPDPNLEWDTDNVLEPVKVAEDVLMVDGAEATYTLFLKTDHTLWAYGDDGFNANNYFAKNSIHGNFREPILLMEDVKQFSVGVGFILVVKNDETLWAWGHNHYNQLGYVSHPDVVKYSDESPKKVMDDVVYAAAGNGCSFVIKSDGSLWGFGANEYGEMAGKSDVLHTLPTKIMDDIVKVSINGEHVLAIDIKGTLYGWGRTTQSQVIDIENEEYKKLIQYGPGTRYPLPEAFIAQPMKIMENVKEICAGIHCSMAIKEDGTLWAWGAQPYGEFADNMNVLYAKPEKIMSDVKHASVYHGHTAIIKNDGTLWTWGSNILGQLGIGKTIGTFEPQNVNIIRPPLDITAPTGVIKIKDNDFSSFINDITFDLFFENCNYVSVEITGADEGGSGVKTIEYLKSKTILPESTDWNNQEWTQYKTGMLLDVEAEWEGIIYARITDNANNIRIICTNGFTVLYGKKPSYTLGDVDNNGTIELNDVNMALRAALDIDPLTNEQEKSTDVNEDGKVDLSDVNIILRHALDIEPIPNTVAGIKMIATESV